MMILPMDRNVHLFTKIFCQACFFSLSFLFWFHRLMLKCICILFPSLMLFAIVFVYCVPYEIKLSIYLIVKICFLSQCVRVCVCVCLMLQKYCTIIKTISHHSSHSSQNKTKQNMLEKWMKATSLTAYISI